MVGLRSPYRYLGLFRGGRKGGGKREKRGARGKKIGGEATSGQKKSDIILQKVTWATEAPRLE